MNIDIEADALREAVKRAALAVAGRTTKPVLECVKLTAEGETLTVQGTDLDVGVRVAVRCRVHTPGAACVPAKRLGAILSEVGGYLAVRADGEQVRVKQGKAGKWDLPAFDPAEFPDVPAEHDGPSFVADAAAVRAALGQVEYAAGRKETNPRFALSGVRVEAGDGAVTVAATDTRRVAVCGFQAQTDGPFAGHTLVPLRAVQAALRVLGDGPVRVTAGANVALFAGEGAAVYSRLLVGHFPDYQRILPKDPPLAFTLDAASFGVAVKQAAVTQDGEVRRVDVRFAPGRAVLSAGGHDTGSSEVEADCPGVGCEFAVSFDSGFLKDVTVKCLEAGCSEIVVAAADGEKPVAFRWGDSLAIVMPMIPD